MSIALMTAVARQLEASNVGYDQDDRWSFLNKATRSINPNKACDCSSGCGAIMWLGGFNVDLSTPPFYTGNFVERARAAGFAILKYASNSILYEGDFVVAPGHHVIYNLGGIWFSAEQNEFGTATGGQPGDQTGKEVTLRQPYDMTRGGTRDAYICRPPAENVPLSVIPRSSASLDHKVVNCTALNLRLAPAGAIVGTLPKGTLLALTGGYSGQWVSIKAADGRTGWVFNQYITKV